MSVPKVVVFTAVLMVLTIGHASARPNRSLFQNVPCINNDCSFSCPSGSWELDCDRSGPALSCKLDRNDDDDTFDDIRFTCPLPATGAALNCGEGLAPVNALNDPCISQNVNSRLTSVQSGPGAVQGPVGVGNDKDDDFDGDD